MRYRSMAVAAAVLASVAAVSVTALGGSEDADRAAVERAVLDYVEGVYEVKPEYIERSVHPNLVKFGYWLNADTGEWGEMPMTFEQLKALAGKWNASGWLPSDAPKRVVVHDVRDRTASVSLDAYWGMDHMQLVKVDGKWMILHVLWQSTPGTAGG